MACFREICNIQKNALRDDVMKCLSDFKCASLGHNTLSKTVGRLCREAGITGYKTNHSLRVTTATCLFQS